MLGKLYIVATPIGNLEDITLRGLRVLKEVDLILAEDTRKTSILLKHYDIARPLLSYHQHSSEKKKLQILSSLFKGKNLALVSDSGTPGISDPGNELIDFILKSWKEPMRREGSRGDSIATLQNIGIKVIPVPGPSALTATLSVCGFRVNRFVFIGFLPKKKRSKLFDWLKQGKVSFAFYESPKRILKTLDVLSENFGKDKRIAIGRELTKVHESLYRGSIKQVKDSLQKQESIKGEIVVVVEG